MSVFGGGDPSTGCGGRLSGSEAMRWVRGVVRNDQLLVGVLALGIGLLVGLGIILFRESIVFVQALAFGSGDPFLASHARSLPGWLVVAVPTLGGLVVGLFYHLMMPGGAPQGVAHVMAAMADHGGRMSGRAGLMAALGSALSLGVGASVGREGPAVHLGATLGSVVAQRLRFGRRLVRTLLGCGVAAGVAASFNAPIAGALFAGEVVIGHYSLFAFAPIVVASVTATVVSRSWFGDVAAFSLPPLPPTSPFDLPAVVLLGLVAGGVALLFMRGVVASTALAGRLPLPAPLRPVLAGAATGLIALGAPEVLGVGYEATDGALNGGASFDLLLLLAGAKLVATVLCLGFGFGGGVFSPSLTLGALVGAAFGALGVALLPALVTAPEPFAVIGMGAVAGAVLGAPISTTVIIFELTGDYTLTIWVIIAVVIATALARQGTGQASLFHMQCRAMGVSLGGPRERDLLRDLRVDSVALAPCHTLAPDAGLEEALAVLRRSATPLACVVDARGHLVGTLSLREMAPGLDPALTVGADAMRPEGKPGAWTAEAAALRRPPLLEPGDSLDQALETVMRAHDGPVVVIESRAAPRPLGLLYEKDVAWACLKALRDTHAEERGEKG